MPIIQSSELRNISRTNSYTIEKSINADRLGTKESFDIFLSHSYLDKKDVEGIYSLLTNSGLKVYVDWIVDPTLNRDNVTKATVELIRRRMLSSKSLIVAVSNNVTQSKWIPWELGFMDGLTHRCAILPVDVSNTSASFHGREFFSVYPYITKWVNKLGEDKLWVLDEPDKYVLFDLWSRGKGVPHKRELSEVNIY